MFAAAPIKPTWTAGVNPGKHSAAYDDRDVVRFRQMLAGAANLDARNGMSSNQKKRSVVEIYMGWRGAGARSPSNPLLPLTFWTRKNAALHISEGASRELFARSMALRERVNIPEAQPLECTGWQAPPAWLEQEPVHNERVLANATLEGRQQAAWLVLLEQKSKSLETGWERQFCGGAFLTPNKDRYPQAPIWNVITDSSWITDHGSRITAISWVSHFTRFTPHLSRSIR